MTSIRNVLFLLVAIISLAYADCSSACNPQYGGSPSSPACQTCLSTGSNGGSLNPGGGFNPGGFNTGGASGQIESALRGLCSMVKNALAVGMMLMVVSSALVYSVGQVLGAETRARASVWATSMFNGAIIAALIYLLVPFVLRTMLAGSIDTGSIAC